MKEAEIERLLRRDDKHLQELSQLMTAAAWKGISNYHLFALMKVCLNVMTRVRMCENARSVYFNFKIDRCDG